MQRDRLLGDRVAQSLDLLACQLERSLLRGLPSTSRHRRRQRIQRTLLRRPTRVHHRRAVHLEPLRGLPLGGLPGQHRHEDLVLLRRRQPPALPPTVHGSIRHHNHTPIRSGTPDPGWDLQPRNVSRTQTQTTPTIAALDREVHARAKADQRVTVLTALPGVGEFTAMVLLAEIGDIGRFRNARALASWAGLTPTVRGSDLTVRHGHISKQGSPYVRWVLGQAAQIAKRHPEFAGTYQGIAKRRGSKIATVAVARKLLTRAYHLLAEPSGE